MLINFRPKPHQDKLNPNLSNQFKISVNRRTFLSRSSQKFVSSHQRQMTNETKDETGDKQNNISV